MMVMIKMMTVEMMMMMLIVLNVIISRFRMSGKYIHVATVRLVPCGDHAVSKHSDWLSSDFAHCDWSNRMSLIP